MSARIRAAYSDGGWAERHARRFQRLTDAGRFIYGVEHDPSKEPYPFRVVLFVLDDGLPPAVGHREFGRELLFLATRPKVPQLASRWAA